MEMERGDVGIVVRESGAALQEMDDGTVVLVEGDEEGPEEMDEDDIDELIECDSYKAGDAPNPMEEDEGSLEGADDDQEPPMDTSMARLDHQHEAVFCLAGHPINADVCASGGADDLGHVWELSTGLEVLRLEGHQDSLSAVEFSRDGRYLASAGVDAAIKIWKTTDPDSFLRWEFLLNLEASEEVTWLAWHPTQPILLAGCSDGMIYMWQIPTCSMRVFAGHDSMTTCGSFTPDGLRVISGTESGMLFVWDPKTAKPQHKIDLNEGKYSFRSNGQEPSGIHSLAVNQASTVCAVGGISNGGVRLVNLRIGSVVAALDRHEENATVEVGYFEPHGLELSLLVSAGTDGLACIHDASSFKWRHSLHHQDAITTFVVQRETGLLTTGSADKTLSTWDLKTGEQLKVHSGHRDVIHMVKLTVDNKKLISCSDDGCVLIFDT